MSLKTNLALRDQTRTPASSLEMIEGGPAKQTSLQLHVEFWEARSKKPGFVTIGATHRGSRDLGMGWFSSWVVGVAIPALLTKATTGKRWPIQVSVSNIAGGKHSGDSEAFDAKGNFVQEKFDRMWTRHDPSGKGYLTEAEINNMIRVNSPPKDSGRAGSTLEFHLLMVLASEMNTKGEHILTRGTLERFYKEGWQFLADRVDHAVQGMSAANILGAEYVHTPIDAEKTIKELRRKKSVFPSVIAAIRNRTAPQPASPLPASVD